MATRPPASSKPAPANTKAAPARAAKSAPAARGAAPKPAAKPAQDAGGPGRKDALKAAPKVRVRPEDVNRDLAAKKGPVSQFLAHHYRHFNAAALMDAAKGYEAHLAKGGTMLVTLAGAMSTAELGLILADMIRAGKVGGIVCTGANLEEDLFNLVAHDHYERVPHYRELSASDEQALLDRHMNRVTDTCIPEGEAMRRLEGAVLAEWQAADKKGERLFPHEFMYRVIKSGRLHKFHQIDPKDSWLVAACERDLPIYVPGWEDSTLGNMYAGHVISGTVKDVHTVRTGIEYMTVLAEWYTQKAKPLSDGNGSIGFFQIGGGIAGDFPICVVPMLHQDLERTGVPLWGYFCQISDSTTSYGSYSGAVPNEKITWGKLAAQTPKFIVESDATIVAPLIFSWVLGR
jgi:deoxyhypusine synthase